MKVEIIEGRCAGAGQCVLHAAEVFGQDDHEGLVVLLNASPPAELADAVWEASQVCPTGAIQIIEEKRP